MISFISYLNDIKAHFVECYYGTFSIICEILMYKKVTKKLLYCKDEKYIHYKA